MRKYIIILPALVCLAGAAFAQLFQNKGSMLIYDWSLTYTPGTPPNLTGTACDIGPPYTGSIPAAAAQAGFTHCAANYDFTQTQSFTDSLGTHQWSNLSSWFSCINQATGSWLFTLSPGGGQVPCDTNHQNIISDGGTQVLALSILSNDTVGTNLPLTGNFVGSSATGTTFPQGFYIEHVFKLSTVNPCNSGSQGCLIYAPFMTAVNGNVNQPCFVELDMDEVGNNFGTPPPSVNSAWALWNGTCGTSSFTGGPALLNALQPPSTTSYVTYGHLQTADNVGTWGMCLYSATGNIQGLTVSNFKNCQSWNAGPLISVPANAFAVRNNFGFWVGPEAAPTSFPVWLGETVYFQRATVWECPNPTGGTDWRTGQCYNNPVITTHP